MSQEWQKILIRVVLIFSIVSLGILFVLGETGSSNYQGSTIFVVFARTEVAAQQLSTTTQNIGLILKSDLFKRSVSGDLYQATEEWKQFLLDIKNPAGSVFVISYRDNSTDPHAVREALQIARMEAVRTIAKNYDLSRDLSLRFLDEGIVAESKESTRTIYIAFLVAFAAVLIVEGGVYWRSTKELEEKFRLAVEERLKEKSELPEWWRNYEPKNTEKELLPTFEDKHEIKRVIPEEEVNTSLPSDTVILESSTPEVPKARVVLPRRSATAAAPANLPIATEMPEVFKSYTKTIKSEDISTDELPDPDVMVSHRAIVEAPVVNPEPSVEELKARLNKLLRGEL